MAEPKMNKYRARKRVEVNLHEENTPLLDWAREMKIPEERFPSNLIAASNLEHLDLSDLEIKYIPSTFSQLINLKELNLRKNYITHLPNSFCALKNLQKLDISWNRLHHLPENLGKIENLSHLDASYNVLVKLPDTFKQLLPRIQFINLTCNMIPKKFWDLAGLADYDFENNLDWYELFDWADEQNIPEEIFPRVIEPLQDMQKLDLKKLGITEIVEDFGLLQNLQYLDISNNSLTKLPKSIAKLPHLQILKIENDAKSTCPYTNRIGELPEGFTNLKHLAEFNAVGNSFVLPKNFGDLKELVVLTLGGGENLHSRNHLVN